MGPGDDPGGVRVGFRRASPAIALPSPGSRRGSRAGHKSISTTQLYVDNLEGRELDTEASRIAADALGRTG